MKRINQPGPTQQASTPNLSRRNLLKAFPLLAFSPLAFAQQQQAVAVRKLHSYNLRVSDVNQSLKFYQDLFGAAIQARQGESLCLRIGDGPHFFSLSPLKAGEQPGISHIGLSVENFSVAAVQDQLAAFGVSPGDAPSTGQAALDAAMTSWTRTRSASEGGSPEGTTDLYFADIEGIVYHLSSEDHCGGSGSLGAVCTNLDAAPSDGLFTSLDLSHFTTFLSNSARANEFYTRAFGKKYQAYQGPSSPIVGVGDGIQFLMYVGGAQEGPPSNPGRIDHVCLSVEDFSVDGVLEKLNAYGFSPREDASNTPPLVHWVSMRMPNRGGIEGGTPEVYFSDPDGIRIQLQDAVYCGGGGYLGDICSAPV